MGKIPADKALVTFASGVWSAEMGERVDLEKANAALRECDNFIVEPYGSLRRRPGLQLIAPTRVPPPPPPPFAPALEGRVLAVGSTGDGKVYVGGENLQLGSFAGTLLRLNADGTRDSSFVASYTYNVAGLIVRPNGRIIVWTNDPVMLGSEYLCQLDEEGNIDDSWEIVLSGSPRDVELLPDGDVIVVGAMEHFASSRQYVVRLDSAGDAVMSFNPGVDGPVNAVARMQSGEIALALTTGTINGQENPEPVGTVDDSGAFVRWMVVTYSQGTVNHAAMAATSDGGLLVAGFFSGDLLQGAVTKFNATGAEVFHLLDTDDVGIDPPNFMGFCEIAADTYVAFGELWGQLFGAQARYGMVKFGNSGTVDASWPDIDGPDLDLDTTAVHSMKAHATGVLVIGGWFSEVDGSPRARAALLSTSGDVL